MRWLSIPFSRFLFLYAGGIYAASCFPIIGHVSGLIAFLLAVYLSILIFQTRLPVLLWILMFLLGYGMYSFHELRSVRPGVQAGMIQITGHEKSGKVYDRYGAILLASKGRYWKRDIRRIHVYFRDSSVRPGMKIFFQSPVIQPVSPLHPYAFDYAKYLHDHHIGGQLFLDSGEYYLAVQDDGLSTFRVRLREEIHSSIRRWIPDQRHAGLLSAMVLGDKNNLDQELRHIYSVTGSMHVLAVSGLHVGLIFMLISAFFYLLPNYAPWPVIRWVICLTLLILYAAIANFTPSVIRAVIFAGLYLIGKLLQRPNPLPHVLFLTAFVMLMADPFQLFDLSFQLSFLAMAGIVLFMPLFDRWMNHRLAVIDYFLKNISMSLSVQLTTLPLTIALFGQLSLTFWLAAMVVVPGAFVLLLLVVILFLLAGFPSLQEYIILLITHVLNWNEIILTWIAAIPYGHIPEVHWPWYLILPLPFLVLLLKKLMLRPSLTALYAVMVLIPGWFLWAGLHSSGAENKMALFFDGKNTYTALIYGERGVLLTGSKQGEDLWATRQITPWFVSHGIHRPDTLRDSLAAIPRILKFGRLNMVFSPKSDNFPKGPGSVVIRKGDLSDTLYLEPGKELFYETELSMSEIVNYRVSERKAYITLNRPEKRNALNQELVGELKSAFHKAARDEQVKVVILEATGKAFCAGADLAYLQQLQGNSYSENLEDSRYLKELFYQIYTLSKPVISKVHGHAIAGGCGLATVCDFVYTVPEAKFGYTEVKIGFVPALVTVFLVRKMGETAARNLLLSGDLISGEEAVAVGLATECVDAGDLDERVERQAEKLISGNSRQSMSMVKSMLAKVPSMSLEDALDYASEKNAEARDNADCRKGIASFLNKENLTW